MDYKKSNKIREIVRLQQILKKWRKIATTSSSSSSSNNGSKTIKYLKRTLSLSSENKNNGNTMSSVPPKGYLAVCVGEEQKRFVIPTSYLGHVAFQSLLREAEEEFGFEQAGVLRIPCDVSMFESVVNIVEQKKKKKNDLDMFFNLQEFNDINNVGGYGCLSESQRTTPSHHSHSPLCR
ncbi:uncharacterized protein [Rutidosis leptorrhynchoides]|uniref:uncharacterized protein n=1 Tax=Rutidosis leptorrhynchoides TaxID=125765 RepID=UPI003A98E5CD